jgi:hypothetical protein
MPAVDEAPELQPHERVAIKKFMKQGADPLRITRAHILEDGPLLRALQTVADEISKCEQDGFDLLGFLNAFLRLQKTSYVHYAGIVVNMLPKTLLKGVQAVGSCFRYPQNCLLTDTQEGKDMTSLCAQPNTATVQRSRLAIPAKRGRADFEADNAMFVADRKAKLMTLETFCGPRYGCKKLPYRYKNALLSHVETKHVESLPSEDNPIWCCNTAYTDTTQYIDHHWDTHMVHKGAASNANPSAAPTPEAGSPQCHSQILDDIRCASVHSSGMYQSFAAQPPPNGTIIPDVALPYNTVVDMYPNAGSKHSAYNTKRSPPPQVAVPGDYSYTPSDGSSYGPNQYLPLHDGYTPNHTQQQQPLAADYEDPPYEQWMHNLLHATPTQHTRQNTGRKTNLTSQHLS